MSFEHSYVALSATESMGSVEPLLGDFGLIDTEDRAKSQKRLHWVIHVISSIIVIALSVSLVFTLQTNQIRCWNMFNYYSPVNDAVAPHPYVHTQFNGSLWYKSPFKGPPTDAVEAAWYDIMKNGMISASKDDVKKVKHEEWSAQFPPEVGGGYIAATIGTHQLHCLHYIWQDHYMKYFPKTQEKQQRVPELYELHYEHCVDYIRQSLMCQFDTGIIPYNWVLDHQNPTPNANTHHKCVDWTALQSWLGTRKVEIPEDFRWKQPEDAVSLGWNP